MTFTEMKEATINALRDCDISELSHLKSLDGEWFDAIMDEIREGEE